MSLGMCGPALLTSVENTYRQSGYKQVPSCGVRCLRGFGELTGGRSHVPLAKSDTSPVNGYCHVLILGVSTPMTTSTAR